MGYKSATAGGTRMMEGTTAGSRIGGTSGEMRYENEDLSRYLNNGGGPEPHQGSNPGAQSDPGPIEVGFYGSAGSGNGRMPDAPHEERAPVTEKAADLVETVQDKAADLADNASGKAKGFMENMKDKAETFFNVDFDGDGTIGAKPEGGRTGAHGDRAPRDTREKLAVA